MRRAAGCCLVFNRFTSSAFSEKIATSAPESVNANNRNNKSRILSRVMTCVSAASSTKGKNSDIKVEAECVSNAGFFDKIQQTGRLTSLPLLLRQRYYFRSTIKREETPKGRPTVYLNHPCLLCRPNQSHGRGHPFFYPA